MSTKAEREKQKRREEKEKERARFNKIYRTPPTPPPEETFKKEKGFVLDCKAMNSITRDYAQCNPKLGPTIPPYNSQKDTHVNNYYTYHGVDHTLMKTGQFENKGDSIDGPVQDRFYEIGAGQRYLSTRNANGSGHSRDTVDGHSSFMSDIKPVTGWHGQFGYRRNTPWLRQMPSPFEQTPVNAKPTTTH